MIEVVVLQTQMTRKTSMYIAKMLIISMREVA